MHEFSIAQNIVEIANKAARKEYAEIVNKLELEIGDLSGVELEALEFAFDVCVKGTILEKAEIVVHNIPGEGNCLDCGNGFTPTALYDPCPDCGGFNIDIREGMELKVKSIDID